jgi:hypothetical protein
MARQRPAAAPAKRPSCTTSNRTDARAWFPGTAPSSAHKSEAAGRRSWPSAPGAPRPQSPALGTSRIEPARLRAARRETSSTSRSENPFRHVACYINAKRGRETFRGRGIWGGSAKRLGGRYLFELVVCGGKGNPRPDRIFAGSLPVMPPIRLDGGSNAVSGCSRAVARDRVSSCHSVVTPSVLGVESVFPYLGA